MCSARYSAAARGLQRSPVGLALDGYHLTGPGLLMRTGVLWSAVASRQPQVELASPHPASTAAIIGGTTYVSSVLPWRSCANVPPWTGTDHLARTIAALASLEPFLRDQERLVWGGDWNHAFHGPEHAGSRAGRTALQATIERLSLTVPTAGQAHRIPELRSIDHIATPAGHPVYAAERVTALHDGRHLSDHDLYLVDVLS